MARTLHSSLTPNLKAKADREGRHFGKYAYGTKKEADQARSAAAPPAGSKAKKGTKKAPKVNTSALFWSARPGPRETVVHTATIRQNPAWFADTKAILNISGQTTTTTRWNALTPALPNDYEVTGIKIEFHCGLLPREVKVQALVLLAKTVSDGSNVTWDVVEQHPSTKWFADVQAINSSYKIPVNRPINSGAEADEACLICLFRAIDSDPASTAVIRVVVSVSASQLKASTSTLDF